MNWIANCSTKTRTRKRSCERMTKTTMKTGLRMTRTIGSTMTPRTWTMNCWNLTPKKTTRKIVPKTMMKKKTTLPKTMKRKTTGYCLRQTT